MALGGGTFVSQNKILPGTYMNFVSVANATASLSDRGIAAMPLFLDWGPEKTIITVTKSDFQKNALKIFGYDYSAAELSGLRDLFSNIHTLYTYRLSNQDGAKASCAYAEALYNGELGNNFSLSFTEIDESIEVKLFYDGALVDKQTVESLEDLKPNGYVKWITSASLPADGMLDTQKFTGGANSYDKDGTALDYSTFLEKIESYSFNAIGVISDDSGTNKQFAEFCKTRRDDMGIKCQAVVYNHAADHEGVINVKKDLFKLMPWITGIIAGCAVNASNLNRLYKGEFVNEIEAEYTQAELEKAIKAGEFTVHRVGDEIRVLSDINSLTTTTAEKGEEFKENQTIRVLDQIGNDIAVLFSEKYLGVIPNDEAGRVSLWNDIVKHHQQLLQLRAIENFLPEHVEVAKGDTKKAVVVTDRVTPVNAMAQLYMTVYVH